MAEIWRRHYTREGTSTKPVDDDNRFPVELPTSDVDLATSQPTAGTTAGGTLIAVDRTGTSRVVTIVNTGTVTAYLGKAGVTPTTGVALAAGASRTFGTTRGISAITASGTATFDVTDEFVVL